MILGFKQKFPWGEPTYFKEKILAGINGNVFINGSNINPSGPIMKDGVKPKIHTFREDKHNRWKEGRSIQMVYRGPNYSIYEQFNKWVPELEKCNGIQKIQMKWSSKMDKLTIHIDEKLFAVIPCVDNIHVKEPFLSNGLLLAQNDGFDNTHDFVRWFAWDDFTGKIIHFTDFKY